MMFMMKTGVKLTFTMFICDNAQVNNSHCQLWQACSSQPESLLTPTPPAVIGSAWRPANKRGLRNNLPKVDWIKDEKRPFVELVQTSWKET